MFKKVYDIITNTVTWGVILIVLFLVAAMFVPRFFGITPYVVLSGSMEPAIHTGALVYIGEAKDELKVDDIIAYRAGKGTMVVHRIAGIGSDGYITKGDANKYADMKQINKSQIVGEYMFTVPIVGYILTIMQSASIPVGPIAAPLPVLVLVAFVLVLNIFQRVIELLSEEQEEEKPKKKKAKPKKVKEVEVEEEIKADTLLPTVHLRNHAQ